MTSDSGHMTARSGHGRAGRDRISTEAIFAIRAGLSVARTHDEAARTYDATPGMQSAAQYRRGIAATIRRAIRECCDEARL